ncbi:QRFP-like peptide receptor [Exaiptasia diaphana]|uniref:G-protein coupled receptors family 1 profile domain-containing protein n=1 Tax=Exaiptasia diaphana TaxID=2652724 RepID=A0A913XJV6_EXADI|nr:QRFP-like peptide receptor [Exaiptasia diaphana]
MENTLLSEIVLATVFSLIVLVGILGNTIVCIVIMRKRFRIQFTHGKTAMDYLLVNLAVSDILSAVFVIPRYIVIHAYRHPRDLPGDILCRVVTGGSLIWVGGAASVFTLLVIAVDRYHAVVQPHSLRHRIALKRIPCVVISCWITSLVLCIPLFFVMTYDKKQDFCTESWPDTLLPKAYGIVWLLYGGLPIPIMGYFYFKIIQVLWFERQAVIKTQQQAKSSMVLLTRRKACKLSITVTVAYSICWLPILVLYILATITPPRIEYGSPEYKISVAMACLNSSVNPFVYALQSQRFRRCVKGLLRCQQQMS